MLIKCIWIFNFDPLLCFHRVWGALHQCQRWTWVVQWVFTLDGQIFFCRASLTLPSLFPISTPDHLEIFADQTSMFWGCIMQPAWCFPKWPKTWIFPACPDDPSLPPDLLGSIFGHFSIWGSDPWSTTHIFAFTFSLSDPPSPESWQAWGQLHTTAAGGRLVPTRTWR